ncbi:MAG: hypothetical protein IJ398_06045 [Clostridia bacterium]|nr:hypothetical protein [Clostridia bacterium]
MKKLLLFTIMIIMLLCLFASCSSYSETDLELGKGSTNNIIETNTDPDPKTDSSLSDESGEQIQPNQEIKVQCNCSCNKYNISMADAILIAQGHYFATKTPTNLPQHIMRAKCIEKEGDEYWYILISEKCLGRCGDEIHMIFGGGYLYTIDKNTGEIIDVALQE